VIILPLVNRARDLYEEPPGQHRQHKKIFPLAIVDRPTQYTQQLRQTMLEHTSSRMRGTHLKISHHAGPLTTSILNTASPIRDFSGAISTQDSQFSPFLNFRDPPLCSYSRMNLFFVCHYFIPTTHPPFAPYYVPRFCPNPVSFFPHSFPVSFPYVPKSLGSAVPPYR